jgi:hypothetical protein
LGLCKRADKDQRPVEVRFIFSGKPPVFSGKAGLLPEKEGRDLSNKFF